MIIGLGSDICDIRRVERVIEKYGERFLERVFTAAERSRAMRRTEKIRAATFAKRFAAKEAAAKALGTGFRKGVFYPAGTAIDSPGQQRPPRISRCTAANSATRQVGDRQKPPKWLS